MISEESNPVMIMSSTYTKRRTQSIDVFRRNKDESYFLCSKQNRSKVYQKLTNQPLGSCFNTYKDRFNFNKFDLGDEKKLGGSFI